MSRKPLRSFWQKLSMLLIIKIISMFGMLSVLVIPDSIKHIIRHWR